MSEKKKNGLNVIIPIVLLVLGLFLVINPSLSVQIASMIIACAAIFFGGFNIFAFVTKAKEERGFKEQTLLVVGVILAAVGLFILINYEAMVSILPIILGSGILVNSVIRFIMALSMDNGNMKWVALGLGAIGFILGVIVVFNPLSTVEAVFIMGGIALIIGGVNGILEMFSSSKE